MSNIISTDTELRESTATHTPRGPLATRDLWMIDRQVSAAIRSTVARHGIKHRWIADQLNIPPTQFGRRIRGEARFTISQVVGIADALRITETELLADVIGRASVPRRPHLWLVQA